METRSTFSVSFYLRADKADQNNTAPIFMRVTAQGTRADISVNRRVHIDLWDKGRAKGSKDETKFLNKYLESLKARIFDIQRELIDRDEPVSVEKIKNTFLGNDAKDRTVVQIFEYHNRVMKDLIGKDYSEGTMQRYLVTLSHIKEYIQYQYHRDDLFLRELHYEFISGFEHYLKTVRTCQNNSALKYIQNFRKVINLAIRNEWLEKDPFQKFSGRIKEVVRGFLTKEELDVLAQKTIFIPRLELVRDIFIFACYTGLAYIDVSKLLKENIVLGIDGEKWIHIHRAKTETKSIIPLLPKAMEILEKYRDHPLVESKGNLLPIFTNQRMNSYLKELADICGIIKTLTFHLARHTFATTITLTNGVPIESVSAMLGHKSIKTTQIYSKVVEQKISEDMAALKARLMQKPTNKKIKRSSDLKNR